MAAKKIAQENYRYITVESVPNKILDFMLLSRFEKEELLSSARVDSKLKRKVNADDAEKFSVNELCAYLSTLTFEHYTFYNMLVKVVMLHLQTDGDALFQKVTDGDVRENITAELADAEDDEQKFICIQKYFELFRFYKKGKYAEQYVPIIYTVIQQQLPTFTSLFNLQDDDMLAKIEGAAPMKETKDEQNAAFSAEQLKEEMLKLVDRYTDEHNMVNAEELEQLEAKVSEKDAELKQMQKLLKNKEEVISKLQKQLASKDKDVATMTAKMAELKRTESVKTQEASLLKKQAEQAEQKLATLEARQAQMRETFKKESTKAIEMEVKPLQIKLKELMEEIKALHEDTNKNEGMLEQTAIELQKTLTEERQQREELEDELARLRQFQQLFISKNEAEQELRAENEALLKQQASLQRQVELLEQLLTEKHQVASVEQSAKNIAVVDVATSEDVQEIDDDIFAVISNEPIAEKEETAVGTIRVVKEENEIDFDELFGNKPE